MKPDRPDWDTYFLGLAAAVAARADCTRRQVGAVITLNNRVVSTGYNGAPARAPGCLEGACPRGQSGVAPGSSYDTGAGACIAIHAEANAIIYGDYERMNGGVIYITDQPCDGCLRLIRGAQLHHAIWPDGVYTF